MARVVASQQSSSMPPASSAAATVATVSSRSNDERQITRVSQAQPIMLSTNNAAKAGLPTGPRLEPISPPEVKRGMPPGVAALPPGGPPQQHDGKNLSLFDYVKNKIPEEMKKSESGGMKRPLDGTAGASNHIDESPRKKARDNEDNNLPPDSPGSPGEMVIDERPDSVSSHASPAPTPSSSAVNTPVTVSPSLTITTAAGGSKMSPLPPLRSTAAPAANSALPPPSAPRYEPLSDDE